jgi:hypothetical protein
MKTHSKYKPSSILCYFTHLIIYFKLVHDFTWLTNLKINSNELGIGFELKPNFIISRFSVLEKNRVRIFFAYRFVPGFEIFPCILGF